MSNKHWDADSPAEAAGRSTRWAGVGGAGQSVFDPLSVRGRRLRVEAEQLSLHADPGLAVAFELGPDRGVVQLGINGRHLRPGMAQQSLDDVLGNAGVDIGERRYWNVSNAGDGRRHSWVPVVR